jgi:hypothetical protein
LTPLEKWGGGNDRSRSQIEDFQKTLEECKLTNIGFYGPKYTWRHCKEVVDFIKERLDRGVANQALRDMFPLAEVQVEIALWSNHSPIILHPSSTIRERRLGPNFIHKASWTLEGGISRGDQEGMGTIYFGCQPLGQIRHEIKRL